MRDTILAFVILFATTRLFAWKPAKEIVRYDNSQQFDYSSYTDSSASVTHIVYCNVSDRNVHYMRVDSEGLVATRSIISTGQLCWNAADIQGSHDGQKVYIVFSGIRSKSIQVFDTYFAESKNNGDTWGNPTAVPRKDMNDYPFRMWPKILVNIRSNRLFIFYDHQGGMGYHVIMMTSRAPDSTIFSSVSLLFFAVSLTPIRKNLTHWSKSFEVLTIVNAS